MLNPSQNPPMIPPYAKDLCDLTGNWWIAQTRSRNEKALAWDLANQSIGYFLPLKERVRMSGGRKRRTLMPLLPSYIFICGNDEQRYQAMTTNRISYTISVEDQEHFVRELTFLKQALAGRAELDFYPHTAIGQTCRVIAGPLKGVEGVVVSSKGKARIVLQVQLIGQGAALEIDADLLEPASSHQRREKL